MGIAYHSTADGQTEVLNRILEYYLQHFVSPSGKDWDQHLRLAEYSYNSSVSTSTRVSPFLLAHGYPPLLPRVPLPPDDTPVTIVFFFLRVPASLLLRLILTYSMFSSTIRLLLIIIVESY
ncbi:hypothetical protein O6H91_02G127600 [Diphasiastrum complanatum]|uniref:Uncharacterized protein n=1 Tax=Diphasiastrum complanatum TaxID=34168 RepID=A0ACC2EKG3_DIPCM|nr:hypothetical protein O6H91_02G127600 [Diphasiastrum complanatum]